MIDPMSDPTLVSNPLGDPIWWIGGSLLVSLGVAALGRDEEARPPLAVGEQERQADRERGQRDHEHHRVDLDRPDEER